MKDTIIIIAKNKQQYRYWLQGLSADDNNNYIYAELPQILGCRAKTYIEVGESWEAKNYHELKYHVKSRIIN